MEKRQKLLVYGGAAVVVLVILVRFYQSRQGGAPSGQTVGTANSPTTASELGAVGSQLAGQEQSDMTALLNREQSDIAGLGVQIGDLGTRLSAIPPAFDPSALTGRLDDLGARISGVNVGDHSVGAVGEPGPPGPAGHDAVNREAAGTKKAKRSKTPTGKRRKRAGGKEHAGTTRAKHKGHVNHNYGGHKHGKPQAGNPSIAPAHHGHKGKAPHSGHGQRARHPHGITGGRRTPSGANIGKYVPASSRPHRRHGRH